MKKAGGAVKSAGGGAADVAGRGSYTRCSGDRSCDPPCSPGYHCEGSQCIAGDPLAKDASGC